MMVKKYSILIGISILVCVCAQAQQSSHTSHTVQLTHYILDSFIPGKVKVKSGTVSDQLLNYNILTGEMIYTENGKFLAISNPKDVDTVYIKERKFVPVGDTFYEVLTSTPAPLYLEVTCTVSEPGAPVGFGMTSSTTASASLRSLIQSGGAYGLKLPDNFQVVPKFNFLIFHEGKFQRANNMQQLIKIFPAKKTQIKELAGKNNTNFSKRDDQIELITQIQ